MKLNPECMRSIMLAVESQKAMENNLLQQEMRLNDFESNEFTKCYSRQEIVYTLLKLEEGGIINSSHRFYDSGKTALFDVSSLTFSGHQYLEKIRDEKHWEKIKTIGDKVGDFSLSAIEKIAEGVTTAALNKYFS